MNAFERDPLGGWFAYAARNLHTVDEERLDHEPEMRERVAH